MPTFGPKMFPHPVTITRRSYTKGVTGGAKPGTSDVPVSTQANVQSSGMDKSIRMPDGDGQAVSGESTYDVSFPSDPALHPDDTITWAGPTLIVVAEAVLIRRFGLFRVRCITRS